MGSGLSVKMSMTDPHSIGGGRAQLEQCVGPDGFRVEGVSVEHATRNALRTDAFAVKPERYVDQSVSGS
jgi:hypothetical protein